MFFLDLKKAFDLVNLNILPLYAANSPSVSLFKSYLKLRSQSVYAGGEYSNKGFIPVEFLKDLFWDIFYFVFLLMIFPCILLTIE